MEGAGPAWLDEARYDDSTARAACLSHLTNYFALDGGLPRFSGSRFESFGDNPWDRIVADDLVAVSMLSAPVPAHAALRFLERDSHLISTLLVAIPADRDLHDADARQIDEHSPAWRLWDLLRTRRKQRPRDPLGAGPVTTAKLLARKRPRLLPIYDAVVGEQLGVDTIQHWSRIHTLLREDRTRVTTLERLRCEAGLPPHISVLRVLDVLIWMHGKNLQAERHQRGADLD